MKKVLAVFMATLLVSALAACGSTPPADSPSQAPTDSAASDSTQQKAPAEQEKYVIGITNSNAENESNAAYARALEKYAKEMGNVELIITDGAGLAENQVAQCETFVTQKVDCVVINPYDAEGCIPGAQVCVDNGIPVMTSKAMLSDQSVAATYVGADDFNGGQQEMQYIADKLGGKGNIVILEGPPSISAAILRTNGINDVLSKYPDIKVLHSQPADWMRDVAMSTMENWLQLGEQIDAVVAENDEMALGAYDALVDANLADKVPVIGLDAIDAALESVQAGELTATVLQDIDAIAKKTLEVSVMLAQGMDVEEVYYIDYVIIDSQNIDEYI